ncbi:N-6 DNA methylase [Streptococcus gallolyticus]|uniref:Modification methylase bstVI n=1 Tax=Streptococcus gallolyticus TaxID=315405 RepID=A0A139QWF5_9STRE|nr:N-6 DNA methylase [Streptococcus gallolyticus]KXU06795.1 Modification methylase bstVI [Streptococcus gallolyticus]
MTVLKSNERSEAIEFIKESHSIFKNNDFFFKEVSGENSLSKNGNKDSRANTLFPDVLYYEDINQNSVAVGIELKMPDTDIFDKELYDNAVDKANRLKTNAFLLWNFKQAIVYYRTSDDNWIESKLWNDLITNNNREDVVRNRKEWKVLLLEVIIHLNEIFRKSVINTVPILETTQNIAEDISKNYSVELGDFYIETGNRLLLNHIEEWYRVELMEFYVGDADKVSLNEKTNMFAKNVLLSWINRITFANLLKLTHNSVFEALRTVLESQSFTEVGNAFNKATEISDFYTIFHCDETELVLSDFSMKIIREYASFLNDVNFQNINQDDFRNTLENIVEVSKREIMGLFTTPKNLAKFLVNSTVENVTAEMIDPCVGSGTIVNQMMSLSSELKGVEYAHKHIWASDKYKLPLQIANLSMSTKDSLNLMNKLFQRDLLSLNSGQKVSLTDPKKGENVMLELPKFDYVLSNLPFIRNERLKQDNAEKERMLMVNDYLEQKGIPKLSGKSDWYQYGIVGIERILKTDGIMGVITSNSWLKTVNKSNFIEVIFDLFDLKRIIISSNGRWFENADVVTTILVAQKKKSKNEKVQFIKLNSNISNMSIGELEKISNEILSNNFKSQNIEAYSYSKEEILGYISDRLSLNVLFNGIDWYSKVREVTIPMKRVFSGLRGVKSGNDTFFYKAVDVAKIEKEYLYPVLSSFKKVKGFYAIADSKAFVVEEDLEELQQKGKIGAVNYIQKFANSEKTKTQQTYDYWYHFPKVVTGDFATSINPNRRLFWARLPEGLILNQRAAVFKLKDDNSDKTLIHALLNTFFGQFMIESVGFGRGLGVLDTTKDGLLDSVMLNYQLLNLEDRDEIVNYWNKLSEKEVPDIVEQLEDKDWMDYNLLVFKKFGIEEVLPDLIATLKKAIYMRTTVR